MKIEKIRMADLETPYCIGWASSSLCKKCVNWSTKYEFIRDREYSLYRECDRPPVLLCRKFKREKMEKGKKAA